MAVNKKIIQAIEKYNEEVEKQKRLAALLDDKLNGMPVTIDIIDTVEKAMEAHKVHEKVIVDLIYGNISTILNNKEKSIDGCYFEIVLLLDSLMNDIPLNTRSYELLKQLNNIRNEYNEKYIKLNTK